MQKHILYAFLTVNPIRNLILKECFLFFCNKNSIDTYYEIWTVCLKAWEWGGPSPSRLTPSPWTIPSLEPTLKFETDPIFFVNLSLNCAKVITNKNMIYYGKYSKYLNKYSIFEYIIIRALFIRFSSNSTKHVISID